MTHIEMQNAFVEFDEKRHFIIEPENRRELVLDHLDRALAAYKPSVVVKAGIGAGEILLSIAGKCAHCIVVEPSMKIIESFVARFHADPRFGKIQIVNGSYSCLPIDYYKADMFISIDNFDFILSGPAMEEFKRVLQFEGVFFY
ncbi:MAG TPA: methyltransferase domain-containing protein, partial [Spirochaetota bacterium]